jgi:hypothetical protein
MIPARPQKPPPAPPGRSPAAPAPAPAVPGPRPRAIPRSRASGSAPVVPAPPGLRAAGPALPLAVPPQTRPKGNDPGAAHSSATPKRFRSSTSRARHSRRSRASRPRASPPRLASPRLSSAPRVPAPLLRASRPRASAPARFRPPPLPLGGTRRRLRVRRTARTTSTSDPSYTSSSGAWCSNNSMVGPLYPIDAVERANH